VPEYEFRRRIFFGRGADPGFDELLEFLRGVLRNTGVWWWFFDGENVVVCMVNVVNKTCDFRSKKIRHAFQLYFWSDQHRWT
jgi:hypothetical protein